MAGSQSRQRMEPKEIRLNAGVYEITFRIFGGDGDRFVRLFQEASSKCPQSDVHEIDALWSLQEPVIEVLSDEIIYEDDTGNPGIASVEPGGYCLRFSGPAFDAIPEHLGRAVIAHELAHVCVLGADEFDRLPENEARRYREASGDSRAQIELLERYADERARSWGFDIKAI